MTDDADPCLDWTENRAPVSRRFGDVYFSAEDGLAETRAVFLDGCGLPGAWIGRSHFVVAELGFGSGLNIAALLDLWRSSRPSNGRLHVFTVEAFPMSAPEASRALSAWPELGEAARALTEAWPSRTPGFHRLDLPAFGAVIDVAVMDVVEALSAWSGRADAWFLDGFSPAKNPRMWSDEVLALVRSRSAPGARAATFTVAGAVRRGLEAQGFTVAKKPGHGRKRERLEAALPGSRTHAREPRVAIVGAGIAGASLARALLAEGLRPVVVECRTPGAGASGNPAALVTPRFDVGPGPEGAFFAQAFERAIALYEAAPNVVLERGALQLEASPRDARRFDAIAGQSIWPSGAMNRVSPSDADELLGDVAGRGGLFIRDGLTISPADVLDRFLGGCDLRAGRVESLERGEGCWRLLDPDGRELAEAEVVCLAAGWGLSSLRPDLPLSPARGQVSWIDGRAARAAAWGGYVVPTRSGVLFGSTFDRGDSNTEVRPHDHDRNLATLSLVRGALAAELADRPWRGRACIRATTRDHLPVAGQLEAGLWVLGGLGSRGFTTGPLLAEHLAAYILGLPSPLPQPIASRLQPHR